MCDVIMYEMVYVHTRACIYNLPKVHFIDFILGYCGLLRVLYLLVNGCFIVHKVKMYGLLLCAAWFLLKKRRIF